MVKRTMSDLKEWQVLASEVSAPLFSTLYTNVNKSMCHSRTLCKCSRMFMYIVCTYIIHEALWMSMPLKTMPHLKMLSWGSQADSQERGEYIAMHVLFQCTWTSLAKIVNNAARRLHQNIQKLHSFKLKDCVQDANSLFENLAATSDDPVFLLTHV